jgi:hypothetical protein
MRGFLIGTLGTVAAVTVAAVLLHGRPVPPADDAATRSPGVPAEPVPAPEQLLLALDGRTRVRMLDRGANRPMILVFAHLDDAAFEPAARRLQETFAEYKDRVEFLTVQIEPPSAASAASLDVRIARAQQFVSRRDWRIPVLLDVANGSARATYAAWPWRIFVLDEQRRILLRCAPGDPEPTKVMEAWLGDRY